MDELKNYINWLCFIDEIQKIKIIENIRIFDDEKQQELLPIFKSLYDKQTSLYNKALSNLSTEKKKELLIQMNLHHWKTITQKIKFIEEISRTKDQSALNKILQYFK